LYLYASIFKRYIENSTDAMGNCPELEIDLSETLKTEIVPGLKA
jgi:hypothetical protein